MVAAAGAHLALATVGRFGGDAVSLGGDAAPLDALLALWRESFARKVT